MVATLVAKNASEAMVAPMMGSGGICFWRDSNMWSQDVGLFLCAFQKSSASAASKIFQHFIYFMKTMCKSDTFNAVCQDNAAINSTPLQHRECSFP